MRSRGLVVVAALGTLLGGMGCGVFDDLSERFKTCEDTPVDLVNSQQTREEVHIVGPEEVITEENHMASGASRTIYLCIERGDRKRFRVERDGEIIAVVNCVASYSSYETRRVSVIWTPSGLACEGW
jgi:hypothetical protein